MNTSNYYENEERKNEIRIEHDELALDQFILNDEKNKNSQVLFHEALKTLIDKYNTLSEEKRREEGIFYLKDDNILLGNITEEIVQAYNNYKALFDNLMAGKSMFFREFDPKSDKVRNKAFSENNNNNNRDARFLFNCLVECKNRCDYDYARSTCYNQQSLKCKNYEDYSNRQKKIKYNLNHFSFYFNGMYFESIALETFFKLIDDKYDIVENDNKFISFLPRIIFYTKNSKNKKYSINNKEKDFFGFSELDCVFVLNKDEKVNIEKEKITCFDKFDTIDENVFFNENNFVNLTIEKDNVVFMEVKSRLESVMDKNDHTNILIKFINKALKFVQYYEKLNLIRNEQKLVLIFLYNNSMYYDIKVENTNIEDAYKAIKDNKRIKLYIAYFQPYLKLMNSYQRIRAIKDLNKKVEEQKNRQAKLENQISDMANEIGFYKSLIAQMDARIKSLEQNQGNSNIDSSNVKDNNKKGKKNSITSTETKANTVIDETNK